MIYRIHHDVRFLAFEIPIREVLDKLGRAHPFHIDRTPIPYRDVWKEPLEIVFRPPENTTQNLVPDLAEVDGKLFFSEKAYQQLKELVEVEGEYLPVTYEGGNGYIFNVLTIAEDLNGLDDKLTGHDRHGNLENFAFREDVMGETPLFRAKIDEYQGIFCSDEFKKKINEAPLSGVTFSANLGNPIGESYGTLQ